MLPVHRYREPSQPDPSYNEADVVRSVRLLEVNWADIFLNMDLEKVSFSVRSQNLCIMRISEEINTGICQIYGAPRSA